MSFADPSLPRPNATRAESHKRPAASTDAGRRAPVDDDDRPVQRPRGSSYRRSVDWQHVGLLGAGLVVGAFVGAGAALLLAPQSGRETRTAMKHTECARRFGIQ